MGVRQALVPIHAAARRGFERGGGGGGLGRGSPGQCPSPLRSGPASTWNPLPCMGPLQPSDALPQLAAGASPPGTECAVRPLNKRRINRHVPARGRPAPPMSPSGDSRGRSAALGNLAPSRAAPSIPRGHRGRPPEVPMRPACFGLLSLLTACTSAAVLRIEPTPRPVQTRAAVPVLLDEPTQPYRSIALIEVTSEWDASLDRLGRRLATEAAKLGGDAVLVVPQPYRSIALIEVTSEWDASLDRLGRRL